jgi:prolyl 4-hydroxylase
MPQATVQPQVQYVPPKQSGVSTTTLALLLVLASVLSSALGPFVQTGLKHAAELYLGLSPNTASQLQPLSGAQVQSQVQTQGSLVNLVQRDQQADYLSNYQCKDNYRVYVLNRDPTIIYLEDFLQPGEAEHMISIAKPRMQRSRVVGEVQYSETRTSSSAFLEKAQDPVVACIERRASYFSNISVEATEPLQVVWYTKGQEFQPHHDYLLREDLKNDYWSRHGQRYVTMLVYLNEPIRGGGTVFTNVGMIVQPKKNDALFWYNVGVDELEDIRTMHSGAPVEEGEKYAINIWQRKMLPDLGPWIQDPSFAPPYPSTPPQYGGNAAEQAQAQDSSIQQESTTSSQSEQADEIVEEVEEIEEEADEIVEEDDE